MQMPTKNLLERNGIAIAIFVTILIAFLSLVSISSLGLKIGLNKVENSDKIGHAIAYFILSLCWFYAFKFDTKSLRHRLLIITFLIGYGIILEVIQSELTTHRTGDLRDILANSIGVLLATLTFKKLNHWLNSMLK